MESYDSPGIKIRTWLLASKYIRPTSTSSRITSTSKLALSTDTNSPAFYGRSQTKFLINTSCYHYLVVQALALAAQVSIFINRFLLHLNCGCCKEWRSSSRHPDSIDSHSVPGVHACGQSSLPERLTFLPSILNPPNTIISQHRNRARAK